MNMETRIAEIMDEFERERIPVMVNHRCFKCGNLEMDKRSHVIKENPVPNDPDLAHHKFPLNVALLTCPNCGDRVVVEESVVNN